MPVNAYFDDYEGVVKDRVENFHGNQLVYVNWDKHLLFSAPFTLMVPPEMTFTDFVHEVMDGAFNPHPEWKKVDWQAVQWLRDGQSFEPQWDHTLASQGIGHKCFLRFQTPELTGIFNAGV